MPPSALLECYEAGQRYFGENYVQEILEKAPELPSDIRWHFIGHLQSNKVKPLIEGVPNLWCVEGVSSDKLATQVNTSEEESKDGIEPSECKALVRHVITTCSNLQFCGLMTIGKLGDTSSRCFDLLASIRDDIIKDAELGKLCPRKEQFELSMGMSGDFEVAVKSGATNVRIGSTIFGSRQPKQSPKGDDEKKQVV